MPVEPLVKEHATGQAEQSGVHKDVLDITVLMGGPGGERPVSIMSGRAVADALERCGHRVTRADISPDDTSALDREGIDVVFIALHGTFGEDGQVQRLCEQRGLIYVGSGPEASALAMDKDTSKRLFSRAGLATPEWVVIDRSDSSANRGELLLPCVIKPVDGGSSVDVTIARNEATRDAAIENLLAADGKVMVEAFIPGKEMTVRVLDDKPLPVIEIRPAREFYDYVAKYDDDATQYIFDTQLPPAIEQHLQASALTAHKALGCKDFSRTDFILDDDGTAWLIEINTIPGFTSHSLLPKAAVAADISFEQLCERIVRLALERVGK
ncbi:MAG: D-alanine--D-alanine ligase [Phycisphaerae bacterium]|nr:D-alanine--D-alanine ligase [Phycisphaerae bacterium]